MGSRSKLHKSNVATTPGRMLLQVAAAKVKDKSFKDPRRLAKRKTDVSFTAAFWDGVRDDRKQKAKGAKRVLKPSTAQPKVPRAVRRAEAFAAARATYLVDRLSDEVDQRPRAEWRRDLLNTARDIAVLQ